MPPPALPAVASTARLGRRTAAPLVSTAHGAERERERKSKRERERERALGRRGLGPGAALRPPVPTPTTRTPPARGTPHVSLHVTRSSFVCCFLSRTTQPQNTKCQSALNIILACHKVSPEVVIQRTVSVCYIRCRLLAYAMNRTGALIGDLPRRIGRSQMQSF